MIQTEIWPDCQKWPYCISKLPSGPTSWGSKLIFQATAKWIIRSLHFNFWWLMKMFLIWAMEKGRSAAEEGLQWGIPLEEVFRCIPSLTRQGWQPDHGEMLGGPLILNCLGQRLPVTGSDGDKK